MNIFRNTNLKWWQVELWQLGVLGIGLLAGATFNEVVLAYAWPIAIVTVVLCLYISFVWWQGHKN